MNRKTSIIICVTCIAIIIISLLGITYGFYITKVFGNETAKSVVVTTADSKVTFRDLSDANETYSLGVGESFTKTFTVENTGQGSADYYVALTNVTNNFNRKEDVRYTLYRVGYNNGETELDFPENLSECTTKANDTFTTSCTIVVNDGQYPGENSIISPKEVLPSTGNIYKYLLVVTYLNQPYINQDLDKDAYVSGKVQISATEDLSNVKELLADKIIANAKSGIEGRSVYTEPEDLPTIPAVDPSGENERILTYTMDDYGTSYYYRGNVEDNYVNYAGMCWRIVRIAGDGSVKIVLEDQDEACSTSMNGNWGIPTTTGGTTYTGNYGYELKNVDSDSSNEYIMSYLKPVTNADKSMARAFYDFQKDKLEDYKSKLKSGDWCLADKAYTQSGSSPNYTYTLLEEYNYSSNMYYDSYVRFYGNSTKEPTLKCTGTIMDKFESVTYNETEIIEESPMYVSALTADEMVYAGGKVSSTNGNFYLLNENFKSGNAGYYYFWSLSPSYFNGTVDYAFYLDDDGSVYNGYVGDCDYGAFRPAVSLASSVSVTSGEGTLESPYIIG